MRCSSCSELLDEYVDGTIGVERRAAVDAHIAGCADCEGLLAELRIVDALLLSPRPIELATNFTFRVMAEVRAIDAPRPRRTPLALVLATYLAFGWAAIASWFVFAPASSRASMSLLRDMLGQCVTAGVALSALISQALGHGLLSVTASVWAILALDLLAAGTVVTAYYALRGRLAAPAGAPPEAR